MEPRSTKIQAVHVAPVKPLLSQSLTPHSSTQPKTSTDPLATAQQGPTNPKQILNFETPKPSFLGVSEPYPNSVSAGAYHTLSKAISALLNQ